MKFSDIIGNNSAKERIRQMIDSDKFPHALLIHGLPGIPKLSLARAAAQYLQCTNRYGHNEQIHKHFAVKFAVLKG